MMEDDSRNDDDKGNEDATTTATATDTASNCHYVIPRSFFATYMIMSVVCTIWFIIELILNGNQSDWPIPMEQVWLELIVLIVLLLSILGYWPQNMNMCCCCNNAGDDNALMHERIRMVLYYVSAILGVVAAVGYIKLYSFEPPLQSSDSPSSLILWIVRPALWAAVSFVAFFIHPCILCSQIL